MDDWKSYLLRCLECLHRYWVVFASMAFSALAFATITFMKPMHARAHGCESLSSHCPEPRSGLFWLSCLLVHTGCVWEIVLMRHDS